MRVARASELPIGPSERIGSDFICGNSLRVEETDGCKDCDRPLPVDRDRQLAGNTCAPLDDVAKRFCDPFEVLPGSVSRLTPGG